MALDFELSEEQILVKKTVAEMLKRFEPRREELRRMILKEKKFPYELWNALAEAGFLGAVIPEEYGGSGLGLMGIALAMEEMASHGYGNGMLVVTTMDVACILRNGTEEIKRRILPHVASGKLKLCFALTEPDAGSNTFRIRTTATRNGSSYRVSGQKVFITGADIADYMLLVTRTVPYEQCEKESIPKAYGLTLFLVDMKSRGIDLKPIPTRGIEGMTQSFVHMDDVEVPVENMIGEENSGSLALFNSLNPERILAAASGVGVSDYLLKKSVDYARERKVFRGVAIGSYQAIQHPLAELKIQLEAARLMMHKAAWAFDKGLDPATVGNYANMAKYLAAELALKTCDQAIETHGGYGFSEEYGIIIYWESVRLLKTAPISKEMILNYMAEHVLQLPRSY